MTSIQERYRAKRVYERTTTKGSVQIRLNDRMVELGDKEYGWYQKVTEWLPSVRGVADLSHDLGMDEAKVPTFLKALEDAGLLYKVEEMPSSMSGIEFHARFHAVLGSWLSEAFAHPFWERMMSGKGSARLFTGWLIELYHYTKNANRHMPLSCAFGREKPIKQLRAKHYAEEWNHYHYFMKSLKALNFTEPQIADSVPLPMTLALSNFMRQAARQDILAYSICSAVLEGTTTDRKTYNPYYEKSAELYGIPKAAVAPSTRTSTSTCSISTRTCSTRSSRKYPRCRPSARRWCSTMDTSWSSTSGFGPTTSRSTTRSRATPFRALRSTRWSTEGAMT